MAKIARRTRSTKRNLLSRVPDLRKADDSLNATVLLKELATAAEQYVNKAPKQQRLAADRQRLLDLLTRVQLFLSVDKSTHKNRQFTSSSSSPALEPRGDAESR